MKLRRTKPVKAVVLGLMSLGALLVLPVGPASADSVTVCGGRENVPAGFVLVNDYWDPTSCGNPTSITYNMWVIESSLDKPVGDRMSVCSGWRPPGWSTVDSHWDPTRCGHPTSITDNVWTIKRLV